jgi:hypothetical protein
MRFAKCDDCVYYRTAISNVMLRDEKQRQELRAEFADHLQLVKREREYYHSKRREAVEHPDRVLSLILDGADQGSYGLPYFPEITKTTSSAFKQRYHLIGVLAHGIGAWVYTMSDKWRADSNLTIEVLQRVLTSIEEKRGKLPRKLYLQMDNCVRENKNRYVLGYLSWLVLRGVFDEIELSFLPVGHTHEDIDQLFSRIAIAMRTRNICDRDDLFRCVKEAYQAFDMEVQCENIETIANIREFLIPWLAEIHGYSGRGVHHFRFARDPIYGAYMLSKEWESDSEWLGSRRHQGGAPGFVLLDPKTPMPPLPPMWSAHPPSCPSLSIKTCGGR